MLIGDSAHAIPSFGTFPAVISAYTLAGELLKLDGMSRRPRRLVRI